MQDELYMRRCFDLATLGAGNVLPNPMVGAVIVHDQRIIGEGWHRQYGKAHAEVNAVNSVAPSDRHLLKKSSLYVSLEPCCIHRNTPPCTDLIIRQGIPRVVVSSLDQTREVNGMGIRILQERGIDVQIGILKEQGEYLSRFRNTLVTCKRPFILLKFAQTQDGFIGLPKQQVWISNAFTKRLVHKYRSEYDAILVGTNTALVDNPALTNRHWFGKSPLRIVLDKDLRIPPGLQLFGNSARTMVVTERGNIQGAYDSSEVEIIGLDFDQTLLPKLLSLLFERGLGSLIVEGGAATLQHFISQNLWDEALVITNNRSLHFGIEAPKLTGKIIEAFKMGSDFISIYSNERLRGR
jgi:diaminohydroxyphosphoribosylaminopyrimidine deaminase/5-amino-6-(5-phosphoribosylamino)uracil reductase